MHKEWQQSAYYNGYIYITNCYHHTVDIVNVSAGGASNVHVPSSVGVECPDCIGFDMFGNFYIVDGNSNG